MQFHTKTFDAISTTELHDLLKLRIDVFVVEQACYYPEIDGHDPHCLHILGKDQSGTIAAYTRILPAGLLYKEVSFGRVAVAQPHRGKGLGHELLKATHAAIEQAYGTVAVRISAQLYLTGYYQQYGFETVGEEYLEDGIPHIEMLRT